MTRDELRMALSGFYYSYKGQVLFKQGTTYRTLSGQVLTIEQL